MTFETKPITFDEFLALVKEGNRKADLKLIAKAYKFGEDMHKGQQRKSGEEYYVHPVEVARILVGMKADSATICAALLHDTMEDTPVSYERLKKEFNEEIADLVQGMTKISGIQFATKEEYKAENLRKILLASTKDVRVLLIRLADRLHNMRTLATFREDKRKRIAQETLEIYSAIAHKLGMWRIKGELEDLAFRYLEPENYMRLKEQIADKRNERESITRTLVDKITCALEDNHISADVSGRAKYFYSIYKKMLKKNKDFDEIFDLIAIRVIVKTEKECYRALDIIHSLFEPVLDRFKDYIQHPKANGYQALHTSVKSHDLIEKMLEIQIKTEEMHHIAEDGIAAHWRYKETEKDRIFDKKIMWMKQVLDWLNKSKNASEFVETLKIDLFENEIIVFTPKSDPISLPEHATPIDFAYAVHTGLGNHCSKAKVNGVIQTLDHPLESGDIVEIISQNNSSPSRNWLNFVRTSKAKSKIRAALGIEIEPKPKEARKRLEAAATKTHSLFKHIDIEGKRAPLKFSKCCEPKLGDSILGFYTKDGQITVHKSDCINIHALDQSKKAVLRWLMPEDLHVRRLKVAINEKPHVLVDLLNILAERAIKVHSVNSRTRKERILLTFKVEGDPEKLSVVVSDMKKMPDVLDIILESS